MSAATTRAPSSTDRATSSAIRAGAVPGALAGLVGGVAFGAAMIELGELESIASLVRADSLAVAGLVHLTVAGLVGAVFGVLVYHQQATAADTLVWGMTYGAFFWFVGPLTLRPLILGDAVLWDIATARAFFGSLVGHIVWGAVTGLSLAVLRPLLGAPHRAADLDANMAPSASHTTRIGMVTLGGFAGAAAATILTALLPTGNELTAPVGAGSSTNWLATLAVGVVTGALYGALVPYSTSPTSPRLGPRLVQGVALGYLAWIVVALTIVPLNQVDALAWTARRARDRFELFPGYVLFGALVALLFSCIAGSARFLFSDELRQYDRLTAGPQRLRAVMRGVVAGIVGGLIFTIVMVQVGALGRVARLVGVDSPVVGLFVHLVVAVLLGITYALLFRRESFDVRSGAGWGLAYGLLWWVLGALTLLPVLLGGDPQWSADEAANAIPALVGHLAYGIGLGVAFYLLEARYNPWWITRNEAEAERMRVRRAQLRTSAPALWAFVVFVPLFVAIVLSPGPS